MTVGGTSSPDLAKTSIDTPEQTEEAPRKRKTTIEDDTDEEEPTWSAVDVLNMQEELEIEAANLYPGKFDHCTYTQGGYIHQHLYVCLTCYYEKYSIPIPREPLVSIEPKVLIEEKQMLPTAICYSCSIACHSDHDLIDIFSRRDYRCDCGNSRFSPAFSCSLDACKEQENVDNTYNTSSRLNFFGYFCYCQSAYPESETRTMFQCVLCEDWFHDSCVGPLPNLNEFDEFICRPCAIQYQFIEALSRDAGHACLLTRDDFLLNETSNLFLKEGWKSRLCCCTECQRRYESLNISFLFKESTMYVPENDESRNISLYEAANNAMNKLDRVVVLEGIYAMNDLRDHLNRFLKPFAESHRPVTKLDIAEFFTTLPSKRAKSQPES